MSRTSSHQSKVDVIGAQYPSSRAGGYGIDGSQATMLGLKAGDKDRRMFGIGASYCT